MSDPDYEDHTDPDYEDHPDPDYEDHTAELKHTREEAERIAESLKNRGWEVYPEKVPLVGQWGYYCVSTWQGSDGLFCKRAHSVRWNIFGEELRPIVMDCQDDGHILSFLWGHGEHDGFDYFEYGDGDVGFVCYCQGEQGKSLVLRIGTEIEEQLSEETLELLWLYENAEAQEE